MHLSNFIGRMKMLLRFFLLLSFVLSGANTTISAYAVESGNIASSFFQEKQQHVGRLPSEKNRVIKSAFPISEGGTLELTLANSGDEDEEDEDDKKPRSSSKEFSRNNYFTHFHLVSSIECLSGTRQILHSNTFLWNASSSRNILFQVFRI